MPKECVESLARHLARAAGWDDPDALVTDMEPQAHVTPGPVVFPIREYGVPVWRHYTDMAQAALGWMDAQPRAGGQAYQAA